MGIEDTHYYKPEKDPEHMRLAEMMQEIQRKWDNNLVLTDDEKRGMQRAFEILKSKGLLKDDDSRKSGFGFTQRGIAMMHLVDSLYGNKFLKDKDKLDITEIFRALLMHRFSRNLEMFQMEKERFFDIMRQTYGKEEAMIMTDAKISKEVIDAINDFDNPFFKSIFLTMEINSQLSGKDELVKLKGETLRPKKEHKEMVTSALDFMLSDARVFHCSEPVKEMLMETSNTIGKRRLPFPLMFINTDFKIGDMNVFGLLMFQVHGDKGDLVFCRDPKCPEQDEDNHGFGVFAIGFKERDSSLRYGYGTISPKGGLQFTRDRFMKKVGLFACNFLDFLLDPNVRFVKASGTDEPLKGGHKALRNEYEGKRIDLSKTYFVKIADPLQRYVDQWVRMRTNKGYSHRFWVRGHFRRLRAERYGENIGRKLWIAPFVKGQGVLLHKEYDVESSMSKECE